MQPAAATAGRCRPLEDSLLARLTRTPVTELCAVNAHTSPSSATHIFCLSQYSCPITAVCVENIQPVANQRRCLYRTSPGESFTVNDTCGTLMSIEGVPFRLLTWLKPAESVFVRMSLAY